jgi:hypothetical protein
MVTLVGVWLPNTLIGTSDYILGDSKMCSSFEIKCHMFGLKALCQQRRVLKKMSFEVRATMWRPCRNLTFVFLLFESL